VLHGCNDLGYPVPNVECDERAVGQLAASHLLEQGHRNFAYFHYSSNRHAVLRGEGFKARLAEAGHDCLELKNLSEHGVGSGEWFARRLARLPKPLGLFAEDDFLATTAIESALDIGWRVPGDLAVVGSGNLTLVCEQSAVPITSVEIPFEAEAYQAAAMLDCLLSGKKIEKQTVVFPPTGLLARQSTNSLAAHRAVVQRALAFMSAHLPDPDLNVIAIAKGSGVSLRLLYNEFQTDLKSTPMDIVSRLRMRKAKDLLLNSREKIEAVSEACGFANLRTFQRTFLRTEGHPPLRWRQRMSRS
jgi:LacI family transcriptional regulator